jgi:type IV pilus assembly protein PilQ
MFDLCTCVASLGALLIALPARASAAVDEVSAIETHADDRGGTVVLRGTHPPVFSVFRLSAPDRIVVDLAGADVSKAKVPTTSAIPGVAEISAVQFQKGETLVGRVVLSAAPAMTYDVKVAGNDVVVALSDNAETTKPAGSVAAPTPETNPVAVATAEVAPSTPQAADDHLIERFVDRSDRRGKGKRVRLGHRILAAEAQLGEEPLLSIRTDGPAGDVTVLRLRDPSRIAVDLSGFEIKGAKAIVHGSETVRFGKLSGAGRVVFDLGNAEVPKVVLRRTAGGLNLSSPPSAPPVAAVASATPLRVTMPAPAGAAVSAPVASPHVASSVDSAPVVPEVAGLASAPPAVKSEAPPAPVVSRIPRTPSEIRDLRVTGDSAVQEIVVELPNLAVVPKPVTVDGSGFELQLHGFTVPGRLRRTLDATAFGGPVSTVSSFNVGRGEARIAVSAAPGVKQEVVREGRILTWKFTARAAEPTAEITLDGNKLDGIKLDAPPVDQSSPQVAGFTTAAAETGADLPRRTRYTGRRISLEFKDIDIQNLLRLFADISHKNMVVSDDVKGKVTIALRNVPWDQAFDLILKTHGLGKEETGNIVRVAPASELEKERKEALEAQKARALLEPLRVRLIPVNYALAGDVSDKIKDVLSDRGVVTVDARTNVLIIKDIAENLAKAEGMVRNLDTQTPQVLIEARIVEAATQFTREIGIQWGGNAGFSPVTANSTGLIFPSTATVTGAAGGTPNAGTAASPNFAVNLPSAIGPGSGAGLGFIFGSAGGAFNLNLRLSALENNGVVKTVSAPKVATLDNQEASISQGVSIPFAQVSAAGVQTAFIEARLELKVTPHVTSDGSILMKISATNNQPNAGITGANGQPSISRKEAKTQMLVRDGDTSVIGGIYTRATGTQVNTVPLLGNIPILGWLFKHQADSDARTELLVFITPRILNRQQVLATGN